MWKNWDCDTLLVGNGALAVENILEAEHTLSVEHIHLSSSAPSYIPKRSENIHPRKHLFTNVHSNVIHNSWEMEAFQTSTTWLMDKQKVT